MVSVPCLLTDVKQLSMAPIRIDIPDVTYGFVYLLVSLKSKNYRTTFVGETDGNLLRELGRHNSGAIQGITRNLHLRPWAIAAFAYNFPDDDNRVFLKDKLQFNADMNFRVDTMQDEFANLCLSGAFGCVHFARCGILRSMNSL